MTTTITDLTTVIAGPRTSAAPIATSSAPTTSTSAAIASRRPDAAAAVTELPGPTRAGGKPRSAVYAAGVIVQDLLLRRHDLPAGHPHRAVLRNRAIEAGLPMARCLAAKYRGRGEPYDDLHQVASLALVKAVDGYDPTRSTAFTGYAVPTIDGALKRHFRDTTWRIRTPRRIQELAIIIAPTRARLAQQLGRTPTLADIAAHLEVSEHAVTTAVGAWQAHHPDSLDAMSTGGDRTNGAAEPWTLADTIGVIDGRLDTACDRHALRPLIAALSDRERHVLAMRYFDDMTQAEIAARIGVSQMHISRLLLRTLTQLRSGMRIGVLSSVPAGVIAAPHPPLAARTIRSPEPLGASVGNVAGNR